MIISAHDLTLNPLRQGAVWSHQGEQLNVNILYFEAGEGIALHTNPILDVWVVVISGEGEATIDGVVHHLTAGTCFYIPAGASRSIHAQTALVYASCHQKRPALMPDIA